MHGAQSGRRTRAAGGVTLAAALALAAAPAAMAQVSLPELTAALPALPALPGLIDRALADFDFRAATAALCAAVDATNRLVDAEAPWRLARAERDGDPAAVPRLDAVLATLVDACRVLAAEAFPFIPDGAARLRHQLGTGARVGRPDPVFPRWA